MRIIRIDAPVDEKIGWAEQCLLEQKPRLLREDKLKELLDGFRHAADASHQAMLNAGLVDECRLCEEREGGSCCGAGLENRYDGILLLINLLLGIKIPHEKYDPSSCFFLGQQGCLLIARHVICVNYLCNKATNRIDPRKISTLREKEGLELERLFLLHERIKKILKSF
jgi:hypothetical protein